MPTNYGVSFSLHRCSELGIPPKRVLRSAIKELGFRRFRIMSYWNIHETKEGVYDFTELDWQIKMIEKAGGEVTLCLGKRQPRWPECHLPDWANPNSKDWYQPLYKYIEAVVLRYKDNKCVNSYQLENEALLKEFGYCEDQDFSRDRLRSEFNLVRKLDPSRPILMTLSDSWGLPIIGPYADGYGMTIYPIHSDGKNNYTKTKRPPLFFKARAKFIETIYRKPVFIHELQAEPWLDKNILDYKAEHQLRYMNPSILTNNIDFSQKTGIKPVDLWGLEWWYWLKENQQSPEIWDTIKKLNERENI